MAQIASELLVERLADWGVDTVFGLPGDGINGIMEGLRRHPDRIRFVLVHHEEAAAFMATAYAKATGKLGVCLATSGPGAIHLLNGLYDAKLDHMPVLAITGMQETSVLGTGYQQEVHLDKLFMDVAEYNLVVDNPAAAARRGRHRHPHRAGPARRRPPELPQRRPGRPGRRWTPTSTWPRPGRRPPRPIYLPAARTGPGRGPGRRGRGPQRGGEGRDPGRRGRAARPRRGAGRGRPARCPDHQDPAGQGRDPGRLASTRWAGSACSAPGPARSLVEDCDTLFMVGTNFPYTKHLPEPGKVRVVQIEADPTRAGIRMPTEVPVVGDAKEGLQALLPLLTRKSDRGLPR